MRNHNFSLVSFRRKTQFDWILFVMMEIYALKPWMKIIFGRL
jgi:hypothetical protein